MSEISNIRTKRWTRSPRGSIFGVATGLAEWKALPVDTTRLIVFIIVCCTSFIPGAAIYLILAMILPVQTEDDIISEGEWRSRNKGFDFSNSHSDPYQDVDYKEVKTEKSTEDLKREYEELKKKVEKMENEMFDREKDWDERFKNTK